MRIARAAAGASAPSNLVATAYNPMTAALTLAAVLAAKRPRHRIVQLAS